MAPKKILWPNIFVFLAVFLILCGVGQTVSSCFVIYYSGMNFIGGLYAGVAFILMGVRCFQAKTRGWYIFDSVLLTITIISCIVAIGIMGYVYFQMNDFAACSSYSSSTSTSCGGGPTNYRCYGESDYYLVAEICAASYTVNNSKDEQVCVCVKEDYEDDDTCYSFSSVPSCDNFINKLPSAVDISLIFTVAGFFFSAALLVLIILSLCCRKTCGLDSYEEEGEMEEPLLPTYPTVVVASAPPYTNDGPPSNYHYNHTVNNSY